MIRTAGILCGSALAISFLIVLLGVPQTGSVEVQEREEIAIESNAVVAEPEPLPAPIPEEPAPEPAPIVEPVAIPDEQAPAELATPLESPANVATTENWFAFWSPFRSELAANGFVAQLQQSTGLDYRVVRLKPGVYEVAFAYQDDADITAQLAAIAAATGLEMPDG